MTMSIDSFREELYLDLMETLARVCNNKGEEFDPTAHPSEVHLPKGEIFEGKNFHWLKKEGENKLEPSSWLAKRVHRAEGEPEFYHFDFDDDEVSVGPMYPANEGDLRDELFESLEALSTSSKKAKEIAELEKELDKIEAYSLELEKRLAELKGL